MTNVVPFHNELGQPVEDVAKEAPHLLARAALVATARWEAPGE